MKVGDLVQSRNKEDVIGDHDDDVVGERTGVITRLGKAGSCFFDDGCTTYYVYWFHVGRTSSSCRSDLEVINESR